MQGLYVQVSKKSGVYCVVHPTYFICRGFYDTPSVLFEGCFILVLHMANVIFIIIILIRLRQRKSFICTSYWSLPFLYSRVFQVWQRIKYLRFLFGVEVFN